MSRKSITDCSPPPVPQIVTLYDGPNLGGRSRSFAPGKYTLTSVEDFNDQTSSVKVPNGLVVIVFADANAIGGYIFAVGSQHMECSNGSSNPVNFEIRSIEG